MVRVLILGGGFGGVYAARRLARRLRRRRDVEIALVSRENYLVFQPLLPEVVSGSVGLVDTIAPLRRLCPGVRLYTRDIQAIDLPAGRVVLSPGLSLQPLSLEFDHLVIALGNVTARGLPGVAEHALAFKSLGDALHLRNYVLHVLEEAAIEPDAERRRTLLTFVIAGGGFSGVELAAELNDFLREAVKDFRPLAPADLRVVLLHSRDRILQELDDGLALFAQRRLVRRGVEVRLQTRLAGVTPTAALLTSGERIPARTVVTTVPTAVNPLVAGLPVERDHDRIVVDRHLAVAGHPNVWAVGDCAAVRLPDGGLAPTTAQHAIREGHCVGDNIAAAIEKGPLRAFAYEGVGHLAALGRRSAVAEFMGVRLSGLVAWWLWRTVYLAKLPGIDRKLRVATDWTLDLLLKHDIVQLKTERTPAIAHEHFETGESVVREGEVGDKLYVIKSGRVEVTRPEEGGERRVAELGPGDYFGEIALMEPVGGRRNATVRALTPLDVLSVGRPEFLALMASFPDLRSLFEDLARRRGA